jgi:glycosyltransferase involved in cell wall biosynthesis
VATETRRGLVLGLPEHERTAPIQENAAPAPRVSVSVILPVLNEADGLRVVLPRMPDLVSELIVVDGHSTDDSLDVVRSLSPRATIFCQRGRGKGNAIKRGLESARGDIVVTMDADGSMRPEDIPLFVDKLLDGHDFVKGSRELAGAGSDDFTRIRRIGNTGLTRVANGIFGTEYTDLTFGFNAYWRAAMRNPDRLADGFQFEIQAAVRAGKAGLRTAEVPTYEDARVGGSSKLNALTDGWAILRLILDEAHPRRVVEMRSVADFYVGQREP